MYRFEEESFDGGINVKEELVEVDGGVQDSVFEIEGFIQQQGVEVYVGVEEGIVEIDGSIQEEGF